MSTLDKLFEKVNTPIAQWHRNMKIENNYLNDNIYSYNPNPQKVCSGEDDRYGGECPFKKHWKLYTSGALVASYLWFSRK